MRESFEKDKSILAEGCKYFTMKHDAVLSRHHHGLSSSYHRNYSWGKTASEFLRMITPQQRMARMRKSFARGKSILAEDYKYFTTPDAAAMPRVSIPRSKAARKSAERSAPRSPKRS
jgi:hypothetical protein